jgi:hypothetical protein
MVVTHSSSTQEKWQTKNLYRFQEIKCNHKKNPYPLPFTYEVLNIVVGYEAYSFSDGYSKCHHHSIAPKDR